MTKVDPARIIDVTDSGAIPDDGLDDTEALQKAFRGIETKDGYMKHAYVFLPKGTYLVRNTIYCGDIYEYDTHQEWDSWDNKYIHGEDRDSTIIKLTAAAPGFQDTAQPKPIIAFFFYIDEGHQTNIATQFYDRLSNLTIDANSNPGAIGVDFYTSNAGGIFNVTFTSSGGTPAKYAITTVDNEIGPAVFKDILIENYTVGMHLPSFLFGFYMENITIRDFTECGIDQSPKMTIVNLTASGGTGPVMRGGNYSLINADLSGSGEFALGRTSVAYLRNVSVSGYTHTLHHFSTYFDSLGNRDTLDDTVTEKSNVTYIADPANRAVYSPFNTTDSLLNLPIEAMPEPAYTDPATWTNTHEYTRDSGKNEWDGREWCLQQALDDANATVAVTSQITAGDPSPLDPSKRVTDPTFYVRGNVRRIIRLGTGKVEKTGISMPQYPVSTPKWVILGDEADGPLIFEDMDVTHVEHASKRTLVFKNCGMPTYRNTVEGGKVFIQDAHPPSLDWVFTGQHVWVRYCDSEKSTEVKITNDGGTLWIGYIKTEDEGTVVKTINGGSTEILQGFFYATGEGGSGRPCLWSIDANVSYAMAGYVPWQSEYDYFSFVEYNETVDTLLHPSLYRFRASRSGDNAVRHTLPPAMTKTSDLALHMTPTHIVLRVTAPFTAYTLRIFNAQGRLVTSFRPTRSRCHELARPLLARGSYYIVLTSGDRRTVRTLTLR